MENITGALLQDSQELIGAVPPPLSLRQGGVCCASAGAVSKGDWVFCVSGKTVAAILIPNNIKYK